MVNIMVNVSIGLLWLIGYEGNFFGLLEKSLLHRHPDIPQAELLSLLNYCRIGIIIRWILIVVLVATLHDCSDHTSMSI